MSELFALDPSVQKAVDFCDLVKTVQARGLMERRPDYYSVVIGVNATLLVGVFTALFFVHGLLAAAGLGIAAGIISARTLFLGHDAAHQQISNSRRTSRVLGLIHGNLLNGLSYGWWNSKHNRHHANPNDVDKDPDVGAGIVVWTREQATATSGFGRFMARNQGWFYLPLLTLEALHLKISSIRSLKRRPVAERRSEATLLVAHLAIYLSVVFLAMPPLAAVLFIGVHQAVLGLHLGLAFAPNHKGMPMPAPGSRWNHLRKQVITSRNVRGGPVVDWMLGGLNYQIEHHLFPSMPRPHLRLAQPLVRAHCRRAGLPYVETGLVESYRQALRHVHGVGDRLRAEV
ncbi:MAG: fatty acid desaturase family protein [Mycobacteriales bacterium]